MKLKKLLKKLLWVILLITIILPLKLTLANLPNSYVVHAEEREEESGDFLNSRGINETLVASLGANINPFLKYDDYIVTSNDVNVQKEGIYFVHYKNIFDDSEVSKKVIITDESSYVEDNLYWHYQKEDYQYYLGPMSSNNAFVYYYNYPARFGNHYLIYESPTTTHLISWGLKGNILNMKKQDDQYLICGNDANALNGDMDMYFVDIHSGKKLIKNITSPGYDTLTAIDHNGQYYFLAGKTNSETNIFNMNNVGDFDSLIVLFNKETNNIERTINLGVKGDDEILELFYFLNHLYVFQAIDSKNLKIAIYDIFGNKEKEVNLNYKYGYKDIKISLMDNKFYLKIAVYEYDYLDYMDKILTIDGDLNMDEFYLYYDTDYRLIDYQLKDNNVLILLLGSKKNRNGFIYQIMKDQKLLINYKNLANYYPQGILEDFILLTKDKEIIAYQINSIYVNEITDFYDYSKKDESEKALENLDILINGSSITNLNNSRDYYNPHLYGEYLVDYFYDYRIQYLNTVKVMVQPFIGVSDNGIYDLGTIIDGNAVVRINHEKVELPFIIQDEGTYFIELEGKDQLSQEMNIRVTNLKNEITTDPLHLTDNIKLETNQHLIESTIIYSPRENTNKKTNNYLYSYIIPIISLIVGVMVIRKSKI